MKNFILAFLAVAVMGGLAVAQSYPISLTGEPLNAKVITCHIATTGTADITIPMFVAPCKGYIPTRPRMASKSGNAAADSASGASGKHWDFYVIAHDSVATAVTDTIAKYTTVLGAGAATSSAGPGTMTALKNYYFSWLSAASSRIIQKGDVICLRADAFTGTATAVTNLDVTFLFVPYTPAIFLDD